MMNGTAPKRAASRGMCEAVASMPTPQAAATMPMVSLSWPIRSSASGTSGMAVPACRPIAAQAAKTGSSERHGPTATAWLVGDTQMPLGAERGWFLFLHDLALGLARGLLLAAPHVGIEAVGRQPLAMPATLGGASAVEHDDLVGVDDGRQPMGDHHGGAAAAHLFQRALDLLLGARVEGTGRLVEQQDAGVLQDGAGDRHALLLATRQFQAALAHGGLVTLRQSHDEVMDARQTRGLLDLLAR